MPVDPTALLKGLKPILKALDADLLNRAKDPGVDLGLKAAWQREKDANRTGAAFTVWRRRRTPQVAIAWVLSVIFVRTLEDRGFLARRRIVGDGAEDSERLFIALAPFLTPRDYLLTVFGELASLPGAGALFDARHNPVWVLAPSADVARKLLDFFRQPLRGGTAPPQFDGTDTRFLGDLYQNLSEDVRKRYALLQTPEFVEEFILDQTLDPAIETFGLAETNLIDPTCGSGHFLLGGFHRFFDAWQAEAPGVDRQVLAQRALSQVYGCDLNPFAVAIARFRLTLEFLQVAGIAKLARAPKLPLNLCVADSLLHGVVNQQMGLGSMVQGDAKKAWGEQLFALEDEEEALRILGKRYQAVVGNPPYITEKDPKRKGVYRELYESARGAYSLSAPFTERFFMLGVQDAHVGLINSNAFAKREFGKALVQDVLPQVDVAEVIDLSGAFIPGHGTPTLILFGRNRRPATGARTRLVLGKAGEPSDPPEPARGKVWLAAMRIRQEDSEDPYFSVETVDQEELQEHPWILAGGGVRTLNRWLKQYCACVIDDYVKDVGRSSHTGLDDYYCRPPESPAASLLLKAGRAVPIVRGGDIRDYETRASWVCLFPYDTDGAPAASFGTTESQLYWVHRSWLKSRRDFGRFIEDRGLGWREHSMFFRDRFLSRDGLLYAEVASHFHITPTGDAPIVAAQSAPILVRGSALDEWGLLSAWLMSSVFTFLARTNCQKKQMTGGDGIRLTDESKAPHQFNSTAVRRMPVPRGGPAWKRVQELARELLDESSRLSATEPRIQAPKSARELREQFRRTREAREAIRDRMVALQEDLDWATYAALGIGPPPARLSGPRSARPGERPFEVLYGREQAAQVTPDGHPVAREAPPQWSERVQYLSNSPHNSRLRVLEDFRYKRRWVGHQGVFNHDAATWEARCRNVMREWLTHRVEALFQQEPVSCSARSLASELSRAPVVPIVAEVYTGDTAPDLERLVTDLVKSEGVPFLAAYRYAETGLEKHAEWKKVWDLQRREDAGEDVGDIPVPPKYATKDYRRGSYWSHRGKLDVPKERFVLYPRAETDNDSSPWLGWAGWDHLQRATALSGLYQARKTEEGWERDQLLPLLAGLSELVPWLRQWHNEPSADFGGLRLGDYFHDFVSSEAHALGVAVPDLDAWRP